MITKLALFCTAIGTGCQSKSSLSAEEPIAEDSDEDPSPMSPSVRKIWVPDRIEGNRYERGHWIYIMDKEGRWELPPQQK